MQSCNCQPRQTLAERINAIIAKYENCPCPVSTERRCSVPKIFSSPCLRGSPCIPCPAVTTPSCCPQRAVTTQPCPGPGLRRYISRRELCPALKGCLSLYKRPSAARCPANNQQSCCKPATCPSTPRCNPSVSCCKSRASCVVVNLNSQPLISTRSQKNCSPCVPCKPRDVTCPQCQCANCSLQSNSENCRTRERICRPCSPPRCSPCSPCSTKSRSTTPYCCSCSRSSEISSSTSGTCYSPCPGRRRLTVFDDPPYTSNYLEREFSSRFIRLDPCYCETDSSSSLENSNTSNKYR